MSSPLRAAVNAAASALNAERTRLEVAVSNLANIESTRGPDGQPYRRRDVVLETAPVDSFEDQSAPKMRYEPSHPDADKDGYVALPNVDPAEEMVDMVSAARAYQANLTAIGLIRDMVQRSLELGK